LITLNGSDDMHKIKIAHKEKATPKCRPLSTSPYEKRHTMPYQRVFDA